MSEKLDRFGGYPEISSTATGYFHIEKIKGRWWLIDPDGNVFISMGVNHIDSSALKYPDNLHIWRERYNSSEKDWIQKGVVKDLKNWGFNTIGWTQEVVSKDFRHSPEWRYWKYQWAKMPYCHHINFAHIESWFPRAYYPDVFSREFEEWCDFLARNSCVDMAEDPYLIGYAYCPMPGWTKNQYVHSWADDFDLSTKEGCKKLNRIAKHYYKVIHDAIRRYDPNHLLLGDLYKGSSGIPDYILEAMEKTVDILSTNWNSPFEKMANDLFHWHKQTGKPILLADSGFLAPTKLLKVSPNAKVYCANQKKRGKAYQNFAYKAYSQPYIIGWYWCAYIENRTRCSGLKNYLDEPYEDCISLMRQFNEKVYKVAKAASYDNLEK